MASFYSRFSNPVFVNPFPATPSSAAQSANPRPPQLPSVASPSSTPSSFRGSSSLQASHIPQNATASTLSQNGKESLVLTPEAMGHEFVKLYVGDERKEFTIHKKLLCDRVDFFAKAFSGGFQEATNGEMHLLEDDPDTLASLVDFIYRGVVPVLVEPLPSPSEQKLICKNLRALYYFAEKICMVELMDRVIPRGFEAQRCQFC